MYIACAHANGIRCLLSTYIILIKDGQAMDTKSKLRNLDANLASGSCSSKLLLVHLILLKRFESKKKKKRYVANYCIKNIIAN